MLFSLKLFLYFILFDLILNRFLFGNLLLFAHKFDLSPSFFFLGSLLILHLLFKLFFHTYLVILQPLLCLLLFPMELVHIEHDDLVPVIFILDRLWVACVVSTTTARPQDLIACVFND